MGDTVKISSRDNAKLVTARKVRDGKIEDQIFIEGLRLAEETLRSGLKVSDCFFTEAFVGSERGRELIGRVRKQDSPIFELAESLFRSIAATKNSQGIVLVAERPREGFKEIEKNIGADGLPIVVFLKEVNDPANLGAVFRTAEAAGVAGMVVSKGSADVFSPKAVRAAMGASLRLPVWENADLADVISWAIAKGLRTTAADVSAESTYMQIDWGQPRLIVFGSEAHGLSKEVLEIVYEVMRIPMQNGVESLNLAVSAGIILFEAVRQRSR